MSSLSSKQKIILAILGVTMVVVWTRALRAPSGRPSSPQPGAGVPEVAALLPEEPPQAVPAAAEFPAGWKDNPFLIERSAAPTGDLSGGVRTPADAVLTGILWDPNRPSAVVNNRVVGVGDSVGPWTVAEIRRDRVILSDGTRTKTLEVE